MLRATGYGKTAKLSRQIQLLLGPGVPSSPLDINSPLFSLNERNKESKKEKKRVEQSRAEGENRNLDMLGLLYTQCLM